ncbi:MAG: hypothetical protein GY913_35065 [Proteobacteria bacterium]|nr:hypothetical protein [Pseudomonadota bacterium]MCP4922151.1 hypothetical protein [Pseudomonadota bacterium]
MGTRDVTRWLTVNRRRLTPPTPDEVRSLYQAAGDASVDLSALYADRVSRIGMQALPSVRAHPPAIVHELLRRGALTLDDLEALGEPRRTSWGHILGVAAALTAGGLMAGGVPSSTGALEGIADAIRRSNALLSSPD